MTKASPSKARNCASSGRRPFGTPAAKDALPAAAVEALIDELNGRVLRETSEAGYEPDESFSYVSGMWEGATTICPEWFPAPELNGRPGGGTVQPVTRTVTLGNLNDIFDDVAAPVPTTTLPPDEAETYRVLSPVLFSMFDPSDELFDARELGYWGWSGPADAQPDNRSEAFWSGLDASTRSQYVEVALHDFARMMLGGPEANESDVIALSGELRGYAETFAQDLRAGVSPARSMASLFDSGLAAGWSPEAIHDLHLTAAYWIALPGLAPEFLDEVGAAIKWDDAALEPERGSTSVEGTEGIDTVEGLYLRVTRPDAGAAMQATIDDLTADVGLAVARSEFLAAIRWTWGDTAAALTDDELISQAESVCFELGASGAAEVHDFYHSPGAPAWADEFPSDEQLMRWGQTMFYWGGRSECGVGDRGEWKEWVALAVTDGFDDLYDYYVEEFATVSDAFMVQLLLESIEFFVDPPPYNSPFDWGGLHARGAAVAALRP